MSIDLFLLFRIKFVVRTDNSSIEENAKKTTNTSSSFNLTHPKHTSSPKPRLTETKTKNEWGESMFHK